MKQKQYFTKHLPVEGEIKEGDKFTYSIRFGNINKFPDGITNAHLHQEDGNKAVKLFLCSRDIAEGDKIYLPKLNEYHIFKYERPSRIVCESLNGMYPKEFEKQDYFKVIGEISPEATWVKDGDEFDEGDIKPIINFLIPENWKDIYKNKPRKAKSKSSGKEQIVYPYSPSFGLYNWEILNPEPEDLLIQIKGPCGHFH